jgi:hypothetical protein
LALLREPWLLGRRRCLLGGGRRLADSARDSLLCGPKLRHRRFRCQRRALKDALRTREVCASGSSSHALGFGESGQALPDCRRRRREVRGA